MLRRTLILSTAAGLITPSHAFAASPHPLRIAASFNAVAEIARAVTPDADVLTLIPDKTEPHDFSPSISTLRILKSAGAVFTAGNGMEPWAKAAVESAGKTALFFELAGDFRSPADPHVWLAPAGAKHMARRAADALFSLVPERVPEIRERLAAFEAELTSLQNTYAKIYAESPRKTIVTGHAAFGCLCKEFGLEQKSVEDIFARGEPTVKKLAELAHWCRENGVHTIFSEELVSPAVSETLAREARARVVPIFTMESSDDGTPFLARMKTNLSRIAKALSENP